jgi:hypothetical protein
VPINTVYLSEKGIYGKAGLNVSEENSTSIFNALMFSILEEDVLPRYIHPRIP